MIKIFFTVRNRFQITKKSIHALKAHSKLKHQLYVYNNLTDYLVAEHFGYFCKLYQKGMISQITFNTKQSTFDAFSKVASCNSFGHLHSDDPNRERFDYLVFIDNDMIVTPGWDETLLKAWKDIKKFNLNNIKVITQYPGGMKPKQKMQQKIAGFEAFEGKLGGSGFWSVKPNFFQDVGYIDIRRVVGQHKNHDVQYWQLLEKNTRGQNYILGLKENLAYHVGRIYGSVCNQLQRNRTNKHVSKLITFEKQEEELSKEAFDDFYKRIINMPELTRW